VHSSRKVLGPLGSGRNSHAECRLLKSQLFTIALTFNREENMRKTNNWIAGIAVAAMVLAGIAFLSAPAKADTAEATYKAKCAMCHGADGKGETPTGKAMKVNDFASETVQKMSDADLTDAIAKGKGKMPAFKTLTADQVKDLVAYVRSFGKKK
jgi:cytochrome c6